jgi:hypothetical protein
MGFIPESLKIKKEKSVVSLKTSLTFALPSARKGKKIGRKA